MNPGCFCLPSSPVTVCPIFFGDLPFPRCVGLMGLWVTLRPATLAWPILETFSPGHGHLSRMRPRSILGQLERFSGVLLVDTGRHPFFLEAISLKLYAATSAISSHCCRHGGSMSKETTRSIHRGGETIGRILPILFQALKSSKAV